MELNTYLNVKGHGLFPTNTCTVPLTLFKSDILSIRSVPPDIGPIEGVTSLTADGPARDGSGI